MKSTSLSRKNPAVRSVLNTPMKPLRIALTRGTRDHSTGTIPKAEGPLLRDGEHLAQDDLVVLRDKLDDDRLDGAAHLPRGNENLAETTRDREAQGDQGEYTVEGQRGGRVEIAVRMNEKKENRRTTAGVITGPSAS
jgi:hypothetical protein